MSAPTFMRDDLPEQAPTFDPDELVIGSPVVVSLPQHRARKKGEQVPAQVTDKARVWVTLTETATDRPRTWRMRLDTQDEGDRMYSQHNARFRTSEQAVHSEAASEARSYLAEQGIEIQLRSPWRDEQRVIELARMIWRHSNVDV
jgi:hypothetical protein